jgi:hypothetical protein
MALLSDGGIGASDCELLRDAALAQPVNAVTSLAYVAVGVAIITVAVKHRLLIAESIVYGACLAAVGGGSVLFHGPQPAGSRLLHDLPILFTVIFIVVHDIAVLRASETRRWFMFGAGCVAAIGLTLIDINIGAAATAIGIGAIALLEFLIYRRRLRPAATVRQRRGYVAIIVVAALGAGSWLLGRTGSPVCDPDAAFQFHGLWHIVSALVFGLWWWLAFDGRRRRITPG